MSFGMGDQRDDLSALEGDGAAFGIVFVIGVGRCGRRDYSIEVGI
jgi:hypothetical protein